MKNIILKMRKQNKRTCACRINTLDKGKCIGMRL